MWQQLRLNPKKTLHDEQEYEYFGKIKAGDTITVHTIVEDAYTKKQWILLSYKGSILMSMAN